MSTKPDTSKSNPSPAQPSTWSASSMKNALTILYDTENSSLSIIPMEETGPHMTEVNIPGRSTHVNVYMNTGPGIDEYLATVNLKRLGLAVIYHRHRGKINSIWVGKLRPQPAT